MASSKDTSEEFLVELAKSPSWSVRCTVGRNPHTPVYILDELSQDKIEGVVQAVIVNTATPQWLQIKMIMRHFH